MPFLLPISISEPLLEKYKGLSSEKEFWETLIVSPIDLIHFFEEMCEDENWCEAHPEFTRQILAWLTDKLYQNKLLSTLIEKSGKSLQQHIKVLEPYLSQNIVFEIEGRKIKENSFLLGANSRFFQEIIVREFRDLKKEVYLLPNVTLTIYESIKEFLTTGEVKELWKLSPQHLEEILEKSQEWELFELAEMCEKKLIKYIDRENVFDILLKSHKANWQILKKACYQHINHWNFGIRFVNEEGITVEFLNFKDRALELFSLVRLNVTRLIIGGSLSESPEFNWVMKNSPQLIGLDLSSSTEFTDRFRDIPSHLEELDLSMCTWLGNEQLKKMIEICPKLHVLKIRSNVQLSGWSYLQKLSELTDLDISSCEQIFDEDLKMIIRACPRLTTFACEDCKNVGEKGFYEIAFGLHYLKSLQTSRNLIADPSLIEIGSRCHFLTEINITRCLSITDKGVLEVVKHCPTLKRFNFSQCSIQPETIQEIKRIKPNLEILTNLK